MIPPMERKEQIDYYTVEQLADRWNVTGRAVRKWIAEGAFPNAYKVGLGSKSPIRVPVDDVLAFEKSRKLIQP